jgi:hypothetical protein
MHDSVAQTGNNVKIHSLTRGERSNNPTNLNFMAHAPWRGQEGLEIVPLGMSYKPRFGRYDSSHNGIRAGAKQLLAYQQRDALRTIRQMIDRWAPPSDHNQTSAYVLAVCNACQAGPDDNYPIAALSKLQALVTAIIRQENGRVLYEDDEIRDACRDALGLPCPALTQP